MASLLDVIVPDEVGNPAPPAKAEPTPPPSPATPPVEDTLPEKLRGKTREEIASMYVNLESINGRMANDLGAQRRLTDQFLELKRSQDLAGQKPRPQVKVDELLDKPTETLERFSAEREAALERQLNERLAALEGNIARTAFVQKHSDYEKIANDPAFVNWIQSSQYRMRAAHAAYQGDWNAADELLSEYKSRQQGSTQTRGADAPQRPAPNLGAARAASLESSSAAGAGPNSKADAPRFTRVELMELRLHNPDKYYDESFQREVLKAYAEGRVK